MVQRRTGQPNPIETARFHFTASEALTASVRLLLNLQGQILLDERPSGITLVSEYKLSTPVPTDLRLRAMADIATRLGGQSFSLAKTPKALAVPGAGTVLHLRTNFPTEELDKIDEGITKYGLLQIWAGIPEGSLADGAVEGKEMRPNVFARRLASRIENSTGGPHTVSLSSELYKTVEQVQLA